ncbi:hypothetical protein FCM35_KLT22138 [Carex littledalei]|uniref:Uncharacterized protein n=1 Tax=Carex littledalei TaxID=544730 RepID=A0A833QCV2_9POAL|nr:hypothetical protein FCM35_KLT22138 [Carex littledalei]
MAAQSRTIPMKKKKRPKPMLTFSSFARCSLLSLPKFTTTHFSSSSSSPHSNANSHNTNPNNIKEIDLSSDDDEEEDQEVLV